MLKMPWEVTHRGGRRAEHDGFGKAQGAYGGLTLNGSFVGPEDNTNASFYGHPVSVPEILHTASTRDAARLRANLAGVW